MRRALGPCFLDPRPEMLFLSRWPVTFLTRGRTNTEQLIVEAEIHPLVILVVPHGERAYQRLQELFERISNWLASGLSCNWPVSCSMVPLGEGCSPHWAVQWHEGSSQCGGAFAWQSKSPSISRRYASEMLVKLRCHNLTR